MTPVGRGPEDIPALLGPECCAVYAGFCGAVKRQFGAEALWNSGGMRWKYECQYRWRGRRLCTLYVRRSCAALQIVFNREEQVRFQSERETYHPQIRRAFDIAETYLDGKRFLFGLADELLFPELLRLLEYKRK